MSKLTHYCFTQCIPHYSEYNLKYAIFQPTIKHFPETNGVDFLVEVNMLCIFQKYQNNSCRNFLQLQKYHA